MSIWEKIRTTMENVMSATAFSDANQPEEAIRLSGIKPDRIKLPSLDALTTAITFAEAGEHGLAREYLGVSDKAGSRVLDIPGIRVWVGTVCMEPEPLAIPGVRIWSGSVPVNGY